MAGSKPTVRELELETEIERLQQEIARARSTKAKAGRKDKDLRSEIRVLREELDQANETIVGLELLRDVAVKPDAARRKPVKRKKGGLLPVAVFAAASDWHTCEVVERADNKHDTEIGIARAWVWRDRLCSMISYLEKRCDVREIIVWLGGDFMVNVQMPHYDALRNAAESPVQEVLVIRQLLAEILQSIRSEFPNIKLRVPTSWGNHERTTPKNEPGVASEFSYAFLLYRDLAKLFEDDDMVEFEISLDEMQVVDVGGFRVLTNHGTLVNFRDAYGGIASSVARMRQRARDQGNTFNTVIFGHWHQIGMFGPGHAVANGSLVGVNTYAANRNLGKEPPAQAAIVIDLERLEVADWWRIWGT